MKYWVCYSDIRMAWCVNCLKKGATFGRFLSEHKDRKTAYKYKSAYEAGMVH